MSEAIKSASSVFAGYHEKKGVEDAAQETRRGEYKARRRMRGAYRDAGRKIRDARRKTVKHLRPYAAVGEGALEDYQSVADEIREGSEYEGQIASLAEDIGTAEFDMDPSSIEENPAYQFRKEQGLEALDRRMAGSGFRRSGNRAVAIQDYAQGLASTEYDAAYGRQFGEFQDLQQRRGAQLQAYTGLMDRELQREGMALDAYGNLVNTGYDATQGITGAIQQGKTARAQLDVGKSETLSGIERNIHEAYAAEDIGKGQIYADTQLRMGDQAAQGYERYVPASAGGGSGFSGGGGGGSGGSGAGGIMSMVGGMMG